MKKSLITLALGVALAACSHDYEYKPGEDNNKLVPINLTAQVNAITRAVNSGVINTNTEFTDAGIAGWEAAEHSADYTSAPTWHAHINVTASTETNGTLVSWTNDDPRYYNSDATKYTHMKAWHPCGTYDNGKPVFPENKIITFSNDGTSDVMFAEEIVGNKTTPVSAPLVFNHKTAQIVFKIKQGTGLEEGTTLKGITIKNAKIPTGFDFTKASNAGDFITYKEENLTIPGIAETVIPSAESAVGKPVMILPITGNKIPVSVATNHTTYETEIMVNTENVQEGYAYTIVLTFGQKGLEVHAKVTSWISGTGSAELQ